MTNNFGAAKKLAVSLCLFGSSQVIATQKAEAESFFNCFTENVYADHVDLASCGYYFSDDPCSELESECQNYCVANSTPPAHLQQCQYGEHWVYSATCYCG